MNPYHHYVSELARLVWEGRRFPLGGFRLLDVFVVLDVGTRRLLHWNATDHPTAEWTVQQCRAWVTGESGHHFVVHDHDTISSPAADRGLRAMGLRVLKTPIPAPHANA
ncbi:MAG: hypothetical protein GEV06_26230 [Luteitalea sp.]|nr:hypothetical protein [Luteitalea sp.]